MNDKENMEIEEPEEWEEADDLLEEEMEIGGQKKASLAETVKGFFTGLLFKSILVALILHVILIGLTSLGVFLKEPAPAEGENGKKKTEAAKAEETEKQTGETGTSKEETSAETEKTENKTEETSTDETTKKEEKPQDETKPTGKAEDYLKTLETIAPDQAPNNPLETSGDELE